MFYLQTKDGDRYFTEANSDDRKEFEKIIEDKLGRDASELFDNLTTEDSDKAQEMINHFVHSYKECLDAFDKVLNETPVNTVKLEEILSDLQMLYLGELM